MIAVGVRAALQLMSNTTSTQQGPIPRGRSRRVMPFQREVNSTRDGDQTQSFESIDMARSFVASIAEQEYVDARNEALGHASPETCATLSSPNVVFPLAPPRPATSLDT